MTFTARDRFVLIATISYVVAALSWIFLSDQLLRVFGDVASVVWLSTVKGVLFVLASAGAFFVALRIVPSAPPAAHQSVLEAITVGGQADLRWRALKYTFAVTLTLAMLMVREAIVAPGEFRPMLILFMLPIILSAVIGGLGPGLTATAIAAIGLAYTAFEPLHSLRIARPLDRIQWAFLILNGVAVSGLTEALRRSLAAMERNRRLLDTVISGTPDAVFVKDLAGKFVMANPACAAFMELTPAELVGRDDLVLAQDMTAAELRALDQAILAAGETQTREEHVIARSGVARDFLVTKGPVRDAAGDIVGLFGISRDITERTTMEHALRLSEERLRFALDATSDGVWDWDVATDEAYRSPRFYEVVGRRPDDSMSHGDFFRNTVFSEDLPHVMAAIDAYVKGRSSAIEFEYRLLPRGGKTRWLQVRGRAVKRAADGAPLRIVGTIKDITARKLAEQTLQRENERYLALLHNASDGIHIMDSDGNILEASDSFCAMLGYDRAEIIGMNVATWDANRSAEELHAAIRAQAAKLTRSQFETRHRRKDGSVFDVEVSAISLELDGKRVLYTSSRDITARKAAETPRP